MSLLDYYLKHGISPVCYLASNLPEHLERRRSLYNMLGLPGILFRDHKVLEIAAGSGQNSLYVAAQRPSKYVIVEPNPIALKQIEKTYRGLTFPHTRPEIIPTTLEEYSSKELFDGVICEGWLGSSSHERSLVGDIADRVAPGGILVLTALSITGWLANLIRYSLIQKLLSDKQQGYAFQANLTLEALSPHLRTVSGMTRRHEDWVKDNMVNTTYLEQGLTIEMILQETSPKGFHVLGASPDFITEWRWFKQLVGNHVRTNENALKCYERHVHNFLDYRRTFKERSPALNRRLNEWSVDLLAVLSQSKGKSFSELDPVYFRRIAEVLRPIGKNLKDLAKDLSCAIEEALRILLVSKIAPSDIAAMKNFKPWFGRETLYFSLVRDHAFSLGK